VLLAVLESVVGILVRLYSGQAVPIQQLRYACDLRRDGNPKHG